MLPQPGNADLLFICDYAANRLRISQMSVRTDHAGHGVTDRHAIAHLRDRHLVVLSENLERTVLVLRGLRLDRDIGGNGLGIARKFLLARGIAKQAPGRHWPWTRTIDLRIGVEPG
jgi:hypothetical protein